jgi:beta-galactosidase
VNVVRFGLAGDGQLIDDLGTTTGSRVVQLYNGRAQITLRLSGHRAVACVASEGLPTQFVDVTNTVSD